MGIRAPISFGVLAAAVALAGCGGSAGDEETPAASTAATSTLATGTDPVTAPASGEETALLERIAVGRHEGYDRVVFEFRNRVPGYSVRYADPPFVEDGSGDPVRVDGNAFVAVRMEPASGFDLNTGEGELVYNGPKRIEGVDSGASVVRELVRTGDFEAVLGWVIGLDERVGFRARTLDDPPRLVIDFATR